jgi:hypothetical protein
MAGTPSRTLVLTLTAVTDKFAKGLGGAEKQLGGFGQKLGDFSKKAALAFAAVGVAAGALAVKIGKEAIGAASDLSEEISKAGEIFGESAGAIDTWAQTAANAFGQSRRQATAAASNFAIFGKAAGLTGEELVDFSTGFTELASDLASFNNTSPEDAIQAIGAALRGEALPLRRYGILLDDASLRQKAFELGIISTTKEALTPQQKVLAAQKLIYEQAGSALGDFTRTADGLANSQRILKANLEDVKTIIGNALLPVAQEFTGWLVGVLPRVIDFGKEMAERLGPAVQRVGDWFKEKLPAFKDFASEMKDRLAPAIKDVADFIKDRLIPFVQDLWPEIQNLAKFVFDLVKGFTDFVRVEVAPRALQIIKDIKQPAKEAASSVNEMFIAFRDLGKAIGDVNEGSGGFLDFISKDITTLTNDFLKRVDEVADSITRLVRALERLFLFFGGNDQLSKLGGAGFDPNIPFTPGQILPNARNMAGTTVNNNVTITGTIDSESAAREIRRVLSDSSRRTGWNTVEAFTAV